MYYIGGILYLLWVINIMNRKPKIYGVFQLLLWVCVLLVLAAGALWFLNNRIDTEVIQAQEQSTAAQEDLLALENTPQYQKIAFAQALYNDSKDLPRSEHIVALIDVLQSVQDINTSNGTIELYDFTVNLDSIEISGRTSSLALLYYPKSNTRE